MKILEQVDDNWKKSSSVFIVNFAMDFTRCSGVFMVDFEQVNTGWVEILSC